MTRLLIALARVLHAPQTAAPGLQCPGNVPENTNQGRGEAPRSIACIGAAGSPARRAKYV